MSLRCMVQTFLFDFMFLPCHVCISKWIYTLYPPECQGTPCLKKPENLKTAMGLKATLVFAESFFLSTVIWDFCTPLLAPSTSKLVCLVFLQPFLFGFGLYTLSLFAIIIFCPFFFFNWDSLHARLNCHYDAWSYKKRSKKRD